MPGMVEGHGRDPGMLSWDHAVLKGAIIITREGANREKLTVKKIINNP